jgi:hypothetical protein
MRTAIFPQSDGEQWYLTFMKPRWHCLDCGVDTIECGHYYMVHDHIWAVSGCSPNGGMFCLCCLHRRLGRKLKYDDFTAVQPSAGAWRDYEAWSACG